MAAVGDGRRGGKGKEGKGARADGRAQGRGFVRSGCGACFCGCCFVVVTDWVLSGATAGTCIRSRCFCATRQQCCCGGSCAVAVVVSGSAKQLQQILMRVHAHTCTHTHTSVLSELFVCFKSLYTTTVVLTSCVSPHPNLSPACIPSRFFPSQSPALIAHLVWMTYLALNLGFVKSLAFFTVAQCGCGLFLALVFGLGHNGMATYDADARPDFWKLQVGLL